jgi:ceramide glucosyltransferase
LTTPYRFVNLATWPQRCDAMGVLLGLWPGIALLRRYGRIRLTLGACTLFRREALLAAGGWEAFGEALGEDQKLGEMLAKWKEGIRLSRQVATLDSDAMSWRDYWRHQRRVAVTYRAAHPLGYAGVLFTFGPVWSLVCLTFSPTAPMAIATVLTMVLRGWRVSQTARLLAAPTSGMAGALVAASGVEAVCWLLSWFTRRVWWSGRWWRVGFRGGLSPAK